MSIACLKRSKLKHGVGAMEAASPVPYVESDMKVF
jgi:hypothetical protein